MTKKSPYKRILLKISGEALMGELRVGLHPPTVNRIASQIKKVHEKGIEVCLVIGGGNIFRGLQGSAQGMDRTTADYMGMLATVMNSLAMQSELEKLNVHTRVISAIPMDQICEPYIRRRAVRHLEKNRVCIFAAGTGNPYFTTDTAASLRAAEIEATLMLKSTRVDGVFDKDPEKDKDAKKFDEISYKEVVSSKLKVMDLTAITLCEENKMPIRVFDGTTTGNIYKALTGESLGTLIK